MPKRKTIKDFVGSVNVNADITPVSRKPIEQIDAGRWSEMTIDELSTQHTLLSNRMVAAAGNLAITQQIQRGLYQLEALITQKGLEYDDEEMTLR